MTLLKRLSFAAVVLAFAQIVFGAIVRITGSGMGCGDHWPKCNGAWFPPHDRPDLIIEITHRYLAFGLSLVILALVVAAWRQRARPGVGGPGGVLRPAVIAGVLVVAAALLGAVTVKLLLDPVVIAAHLSIAMTLLATLALAHFRAGGMGAGSDFSGASHRAWSSARASVALAFVVLVLGGFTANLPDAASSCGGFPLCRSVNASGTPLTIHVLHRIAALLLLGHLAGMFIAARKRGEPPVIRRAAGAALAVAVVQVIVAALMIEMQFPPVLRSLHQAVGTLVWLLVVIAAIVSAHGARPRPSDELVRVAA
jgi:heme A synthase